MSDVMRNGHVAEHLDSVAEQHSAALEPVIAALQAEVAALNADMEQQLLAASVAQQELNGMLGRLQEVSRLATLRQAVPNAWAQERQTLFVCQ